LILSPHEVGLLHEVSSYLGGDAFFAVPSKDELFVFNWALGLRFRHDEVMRCPHVSALLEETDRVCKNDERREIVEHIAERSWMDILIGSGFYQDAHLERLLDDEVFIFRSRNTNVLPFETDAGNRYYVREEYFDLAEEIIGDEISPMIFRPMQTPITPRAYRPMLFLDGKGEVRGLLRATSSADLNEALEHEYRTRVEETLPEYYTQEGR